MVERLLEELRTALEKSGEKFEVICVNDGSSDATLPKLLSFREGNPYLKIISLSRNFGLQAALTAGIEYASGEYVVIMDGDFQDPPELVPVLLEKIKSTDADIVSAVRQSRNEKFTKKLYINIFHRIFDKVTKGQ